MVSGRVEMTFAGRCVCMAGLALGLLGAATGSSACGGAQANTSPTRSIADPVAAQQAPPPPAPVEASLRVPQTLPTAEVLLGPFFGTLDCDQQGYIDGGQVDEHFSQLFAPYDLDRSRTLTRNEYLAISPPGPLRERREQLFAAGDRDGDGLSSANEYRRHLHEALQTADGDRNGEVTRQELRTPAFSAEGSPAQQQGAVRAAPSPEPSWGK